MGKIRFFPAVFLERLRALLSVAGSSGAPKWIFRDQKISRVDGFGRGKLRTGSSRELRRREDS